ncbi:MAG TPA: class I SAM-dependent methyltransferase [Syntrophales bacterium]|nr:class I SAM-dependent methyltransferase [Syntrophales bacterium]
MHDQRSDKPRGAGKSSFELIEAGTLFQILALKPGHTTLDMRCGTGMYTLAMAEIVGEGGRVHAVDLWAEGVERLREMIERRGVKNVRPIVADLGKPLPLPAESRDLILMAAVLHDLKEAGLQDGALAEARRLLKRYGTLAVIEFTKTPGTPGPPVSRRLSPEEVESRVSPFGFRRSGLQAIGPYSDLMTFVPKTVCNA